MSNTARRLSILGLAVAALGAGVLAGRLTQSGINDDAFWSNVYVEGVSAETFESATELARSADVVVTGHITALTESRSWLADPDLGKDGVAFYARAAVKVDEVLAGTYEPGADKQLGVEFFIPNWPEFPRMSGSIPDEQVLLFLRRQPDTEEPLYRVVNITQGYYRDTVHVQAPVGASDPWVMDLGRLSFTDLVAEIRQVARD